MSNGLGHGQTPTSSSNECGRLWDNSEQSMDEFDRIKVIGKGSYGEVWLAKHKKDKKQVRTLLGLENRTKIMI